MILHYSRSNRLTSHQGADRIAERLRHSNPGPDGDHPGYCCEDCGHTQFAVQRAARSSCEVESSLDCSCGRNDEGTAATVMERLHYERHWYQTLNDDHCLEAGDFDQEDELRDRELLEREIDCDECFAQAADTEWDHDDVAEQEDQVDFFVRCAYCGHEIEFGWSHPERGGRIWPCESADFDPLKIWPEPRYLEAWRERGWCLSNS